MWRSKKWIMPSVVLVAISTLVFAAIVHRSRGRPPAVTVASINVISGDDRGPGTLREALFAADSARGHATIVLRVNRIVVESPLPPLVNPAGTEVESSGTRTTIDASGLKSGPVIDVDGAGSAIERLEITHCPATAILVRASRFRLERSGIDACPVGVDVAPNAAGVTMDGDVFTSDPIGVRLAAAKGDTEITGNRFVGDSSAGLWMVRATAESDSGARVVVRANVFDKDQIGAVVGNLNAWIVANRFTDSQASAVSLIGSGVTVANNQIAGGPSMGVVADGVDHAQIVGNEIQGVGAYAIMVRASQNAIVRGNRIAKGAYGIAFVLDRGGSPNVAVENLIVDLRYDGIDVLGASPVLRANRILGARGIAIRVSDFKPPSGEPVVAHPYLDANVSSLAASGPNPAARRVGAPR